MAMILTQRVMMLSPKVQGRSIQFNVPPSQGGAGG